MYRFKVCEMAFTHRLQVCVNYTLVGMNVDQARRYPVHLKFNE